MKSASKFVISKSFWNKEKPDDLKKSDKKFQSAIDSYASALDGLKKPTAAGLKSFDDAESGLKSAASDVAAEAGKLAAACKKDKKKKEAYDNTVAVLKKPLAKILSDNRKEYDKAAEALNGADDEAADPFASDEAHAAYLKGIANKLYRRKMSFALAMQSNNPSEIRFNFHVSKGGRSLVGAIKKSVQVKKFTFGTAASETVFAGQADDGTDGDGADDDGKRRTLVLDLEGKQIPGLAKRVRKMFRLLGLSAFNKVKILQAGEEFEAADDDVDDDIDDLDMTEDPDLEEIAVGDDEPVGADDDAPLADAGAPAGDVADPPVGEPPTGDGPGKADDKGKDGAPDKGIADDIVAALTGAWTGLLNLFSTPEERQQFARFGSSGIPAEEAFEIVKMLKADPAKVTAALKDVKDMTDQGVPPARLSDMIAFKEKNPAGYAAMLECAKKVAGSPVLDASRTELDKTKKEYLDAQYQNSVAARKRTAAKTELDRLKTELTAKTTAETTAQSDLTTAQSKETAAANAVTAEEPKEQAAKAALDKAQKALEKANKALDDYQNTLPEWSKTTPDQRMERNRRQTQIELAEAALATAKTDHTKAKEALDKAKEALAAAKTDVAAKQTALTTAQNEKTAAQTAVTTQQGVYDTHNNAVGTSYNQIQAARAKEGAIKDKRLIFDAVAVGPLSSIGLAPPLSDAQVTQALKIFARNPKVGAEMLKLLKTTQKRGDVIESAGKLLDLMDSGFADKDGNKPTAFPPDKAQLIVAGALKMVGQRGKAYADGLLDYYKEGKHLSGGALKTDPALPTDAPKKNADDETKRLQDVANKRANKMAGLMIGSDGKVDVDNPKIKEALDDMLYHPGALMAQTPEAVKQIEGTLKLLTGPQKSNAAHYINRVKRPTDPKKQATVDGLVKKSLDLPGTPDDADARKALLSAMMTPVQQGPVGSCFTTGPIRKLREDNPMQMLSQMSNMLRSGEFHPASGPPKVPAVPASAIIPGENTLLKSYEYSAAAAAASRNNSNWKGKVDRGLFNGSKHPGKDLDGIGKIIGGKWDHKPFWDFWYGPSKRDELRKAIKKELTFTYDAQKKDSTGAGDGSSSHGKHILMFRGAPVDSEEKFVKAIIIIAKDVLKVDWSSKDGKKILALIKSTEFRENMLESFKVKDHKGKPRAPWNVSGGGWGSEVTKVLTNDDIGRQKLFPAKRTGTDGEKAATLLQGLVTQSGGKGDSLTMSTNGKGANHSFNLLPNHPDMKKLRTGDVADNIDKTLVKPGKKIASTDLPLAKVREIFDNVMDAIRGWFHRQARDELSTAAAKVPSAPMTPGEVAKHLTEILKDPIKDDAKETAEDWKAKRLKAGKSATTAEVNKKSAERAKNMIGWVKGEITKQVGSSVPVPTVVVADTNWGSSKGQTYFVMAPDPIDGELKLWKKTEPDGTMRLADSYLQARWSRVE